MKILTAALALLFLTGASGELAVPATEIGHFPRSTNITNSGVLADGTESKWVVLATQQTDLSIQNKMTLSESHSPVTPWDVFDSGQLASITYASMGDLYSLDIKNAKRQE